MKKYNEFKYELGNDENGNRAWINPVLVREGVAMEERFANDLNAQFVNSGVKYEEVEEDVINHVITKEDLVNNPDLLGVVKEGDTIQITKDEIVDPATPTPIPVLTEGAANVAGGIELKAEEKAPVLEELPVVEETQKIEPPVIPAEPVVEATPEPAIIPAPEAPAAAENGNTEGRV